MLYHVLTVVRIHNGACLYLSHSGIITLFLIRTLGSAKAHLGAFGTYEVLTAPHGRLSGSHITLDLHAHERNTHQTTQTHRWSLHQQPATTLFNYQHTLGRPLLSCHRSVSDTGARREEPERDGKLRIPASKTWKNPNNRRQCLRKHTHTIIAIHCMTAKQL